MSERLSWKQIEELYNHQWVELVDYDWPEGKAFPVSGIVRLHSPDRCEFDRQLLADASPESALIFVGDLLPEPGVIYSATNLALSGIVLS